MSFEGYDQFLCARGHLSEFDAYGAGAPETCAICGAAFVWHHGVDQTNGIDPADPGTFPVSLQPRLAWEDLWKEDHYGNRYAIKRVLYEIPEEGRILPAGAEVEERASSVGPHERS